MGGEQRDLVLHELSVGLGKNTQGLQDLTKLFDQHCKDDDRRHGENMSALKAVTDAIGCQNKALKAQRKELEKLTSRVALTSPGGGVLSRKQIAALAVVGTSWSWLDGSLRLPSNGRRPGCSVRS
jgi:hypothetical protein